MSLNNPTLEALRKRIAEIESASDVSFDTTSSTPVQTRTSSSLYQRQRENNCTTCKEDLHDSCKQDEDKDNKSARAAFQKIVRLANHSEQASALLRKRLIRDGFEEDTVQCALSRAIDYGIVDDRRYAEMLVSSRLNQHKGLESIRRELDDIGVDPDTVETLQEYEEYHDECDERERAYDVLLKRPPHSKNIRNSAYRKLIQKGFSVSVAADVARKYAKDHES